MQASNCVLRFFRALAALTFPEVKNNLLLLPARTDPERPTPFPKKSEPPSLRRNGEPQPQEGQAKHSLKKKGPTTNPEKEGPHTNPEKEGPLTARRKGQPPHREKAAPTPTTRRTGQTSTPKHKRGNLHEGQTSTPKRKCEPPQQEGRGNHHQKKDCRGPNREKEEPHTEKERPRPNSRGKGQTHGKKDGLPKPKRGVSANPIPKKSPNLTQLEGMAPRRKGQPPTPRRTPTPLRRTKEQVNPPPQKGGRTATARRGNDHDKKDSQLLNSKPEKADPNPTPRRKGHAPTREGRTHPDKAGRNPTSRRMGQTSSTRRKGQPHLEGRAKEGRDNPTVRRTTLPKFKREVSANPNPQKGQPPTPRRNGEPPQQGGRTNPHPEKERKDEPNTAPRRKCFFSFPPPPQSTFPGVNNMQTIILFSVACAFDLPRSFMWERGGAQRRTVSF